METKRKLASIQKIVETRPIEGADKIEVVQVLGWECVAKKGEFKVGDLVVYIEVDSILPEKLIKLIGLWDDTKNIGRLGGNSGNRVRTRKFLGQISQGLVFNTNILNKY